MTQTLAAATRQNVELRAQLKAARTDLKQYRQDAEAGVKYLLDHANLDTEVGRWWSRAITNALPDAAAPGVQQKAARAQKSVVAVRTEPILPGWFDLFEEICEENIHRPGTMLSLGKLLTKLKARPGTDLIKLDRLGLGHNPGGHGSYRGHYEDLYIDYTSQQERTVAEFRKDLRTALGRTFTGYKGGEFVMNPTTRVWVDEHGSCDNILVTGVVGRDGLTVILTTELGF